MQTSGTNYYYHADALGSITAITNNSGAVVKTYAYDSFGQMTPSGTLAQPYTYTAREYDSESYLYYYRARYYDPKAGRFITKDPIGFGGGDVNLYAYVQNDPVNWVDPLGLDATNWSNTDGGRSRFDGPTNGNWGGKCWSGGQYSCGKTGLGKAPPADSGDECYKRHDECFDVCGSNKQCLATCNKKLVDELRRLPDDPRKWPNPPRPGTEGDSRSYRDKAIRYFR